MEKKKKIFLYGLDYAGKTTIFETMKEGNTISDSKPTLSFRIANYLIENTTFQFWDAPGQISFRHLWNKGYERADILIFVLDVADEARYEEAYKEFHKVVNQDVTAGLPLIFLFHKMDLQIAQENLPKAREKFPLSSLRRRKIISYETSIYKIHSIYKLRSTLANIVMGTMW